MKTGRPVVFVNLSGSAIAMPWEADNLPAILQAWYPGQNGGIAVADVLFGNYNPAGRLPVTFYRSTADLPDFSDYSMANRTYRYFKGKPLFAFGHGLSYTTFEYSDVKIQIFDFSGRLVDHVINEVQSVGSYHTEWSGNSFPSGVYIARVDPKGYITNQKTNQQIKLLLIR